MEDSSTAAVSDALSEITRKERRALLGVSTLCIAITHANLVPTKISALGIEADTKLVTPASLAADARFSQVMSDF